MDSFIQEMEHANQSASHLSYVAARMPPEHVVTLVEYLGEKITPLVITLLQPHFQVLAAEAPSPGLDALRACLQDRADQGENLKIESLCLECDSVASVGANVEDQVLDVVLGDTPVERAVEAILKTCSDPLQYLSLQCNMILHWELPFLPLRALPRSIVCLHLTERLLPGNHKGQVQLAHLACQMALKLCHFECCLDIADQLLDKPDAISSGDRSFLRTFRGCACAGLGDVAGARQDFLAAARDAEQGGHDDSTALCFALLETYRLGLTIGDWTGLPAAAAQLNHALPYCNALPTRSMGWGFFAVCQYQMDHREVAWKNFHLARDAAHDGPALDAELDLANLQAMLLIWEDRPNEAVDVFRRLFPLLALSGNAFAAAETESLIHQMATRNEPSLSPLLPADWQDQLPEGICRPFLQNIFVTAGHARLAHHHDQKKAAQLLAAAIRDCEQVRRSVAADQLQRFCHCFVEVYRLFLDLPAGAYMSPEEYAGTLQSIIGLLASDELTLDRAQARALLQIHFAERGQELPADEALLKAEFDAASPDLQLVLPSGAARWQSHQLAPGSAASGVAHGPSPLRTDPRLRGRVARARLAGVRSDCHACGPAGVGHRAARTLPKPPKRPVWVGRSGGVLLCGGGV